jgi:catechol-2,3-dioxygenase
MDFLQVRLGALAASLAALADFYEMRLGIERVERSGERLAIEIGATQLKFARTGGRPFYHFALLAPGNRFAELLEWAKERVELLPERDRGEVVCDFSTWRAYACYFHDPAGNIVELIPPPRHGRDEDRRAVRRERAARLLRARSRRRARANG